MANEKPETVTVEACEAHTYHGQAYDVGDTYEIDEQDAESVVTQGKAQRVDRADRAAHPKKPSQPVEPMGTKDHPSTATPRKK